MARYFHKKKIIVICHNCKERHDEQDVEFLDICEDIQGHDILTFICPSCGKRSESKRLG